MQYVISLLVLGLAVSAHALRFKLDRAVVESLLYRQLTLSCQCADRSQFCEFFSDRCTTSYTMRYTCPVTCGMCTECPPERPPPTLIPPVSKCEFTCKDNWNRAVCGYYKDEGQCKFFKSNCRATCGECRQCRLPPDELPACTNDCKDLRGERSCTFWNSRGLCGNRDVRYVCQKTCGACTLCPAA